MKTYSPKPEHIEHRWYVVDASGQVLGRLASEVAVLLRGKHKPMYAPHMDTGDHVVVINADKIELTGNKGEDKYAYRHSGYPGGITGVKYKDFMTDRPVAAFEKAVRGMLPKNTLGRQMIKKLHVVPGAEHPHAAQAPVSIQVGERPAWGGLPATKASTGPAPKAPAAEKPAAKPKAAAKPKTAAPSKAEPPENTETPAKPKAATKTAKPKATAAAKPKAATAKKAAAKPKTAAKPKPKKTETETEE
jgi:large subunit ribosomal protein L13